MVDLTLVVSSSPKRSDSPPVEHEVLEQLDVDLEKAFRIEKQWTVNLATFASHVSPDLVPASSHSEPNAAQYDRFSSRRKIVITAVLAYVCILPPSSSTSVLPAIPEVAAEYGSTGSIIGISNALYMLFMGLSPCFCGSLTQIYGRWPVSEPSHLVESIVRPLPQYIVKPTSSIVSDGLHATPTTRVLLNRLLERPACQWRCDAGRVPELA